MSSQYYRYSAYSTSGSNVDVTVEEEPFKFDSNGAIVFGAWRTPMSAVTVGPSSLAAGATQNNTTDKYIGANLLVTCTGSGGIVTIFLEYSPDGGTTWPDARKGRVVGNIEPGQSHKVVEV